MRGWRRAVGPLAVAAAALASYPLSRLASIGAAYKAKILASAVFVSHRDPASVAAADLALSKFPIMRLLTTRIDYDRKEVSSGLFGIIQRKAQYRPGLGCSLCYDSHPLQSPKTGPSPNASSPLVDARDPRLDPVLDWAFSEPDRDRPRKTRAVLVLHKGRIVAERYAAGFDKDTPLHGWSMAKAVTNALVGTLVKEGRVALESAAPVPEWQGAGDPRRRITINNLMQMSSGLHFKENYGNPFQDVVYMLFMVPDAASYAARKPLDAEPGTRWSYSSGTTNIICRIIRSVVGEEEYDGFPRKSLFNRIGMSSAVLEQDPSGTFIGSSFAYATARDWARFGQLYLQDGVWEGERILPEGWVKYSTMPAPHDPEKAYGAHLWLKIPRDFSSDDAATVVPADAFHAVGHEGQLLTVIPSKELVIVRLGLTRYSSAWLHDQFIARVLKVVDLPLPSSPPF